LTKPRHVRTGRASDLARGLAALAALVALVVGAPAALALVVGWPLPHAIPSVAELSQALTTGSIPDEFFGKTLAVLGWIYWVHFIVCLAAELAAARRGRLARRVPFAGWNQAIAARLIGALLLLGPTPGLARAVPAFAVERPAPVVMAVAVASDSATREAPDQPDGELQLARPATEAPVYTVQAKQVGKPRDTLWGIAERFLGNPYRWPEIFRLNKGHPLPDPPGGSFTNPDRIYPGQKLLMPPDATGLSSADQDRTRTDPDDDRRPPSTEGEARPTAPPPAAAAAPTTAPPTTAPPTTAPPTSSAPTTAAPTSQAADRQPATTTPLPADGSASNQAEEQQDVPIGAIAVGIGGLLAVGVLATLARQRRRQQRHRRPGRRPRLPVGEAARTEQRLRAAAEPEWARFLDAALRTMAARIRHMGMAPPTVEAVLLGATTLEILLREPVEVAPTPFTLSDDGRRWTLPCHIPVPHLETFAEDAVAPLPGLVTLGMSEAGQLLVNLEAPGLTALAGPAAGARPLLDAMAVEFATAASSGFVQVLLVGFGPELDRLERVQRVAQLEDALPDLERQAEDSATLLEERGCASVYGGRIAGAGADSWTPTVVLVAQPPSAEALERLAAVTSDPRGSTIAAVLLGDCPQAGWQLEVGEELVRVPGLDLEVQPQRLTPAEYSAIGELLTTAGDVDGVPPDAAPYSELQPTGPAEPPVPAQPSSSVEESSPTNPSTVVADLQSGRLAGARLAAASLAGAESTQAAVEVQVLGRVQLHGVRKIERSKSIELIVYLALHPQGVDGDHLWEALWPEKPLVPGTLHTTVTTARTGLGRAPDKTRYLPDARDGLYRLSEAVGLDWARFQALAGRGQAGGPDAPVVLRQALELVRGTPLESPVSRSYEWAVVHRTEMETVIAEVAERLGLLCLDAEDPEQANWAARRGLAASPYDERLYRVLMRSAHAAGNPAGVEAVWQELLAVLGADLELVDEDLHPETVACYSALRGSRRPRPAAQQPPRRSPIPLN
jgi:DNA-binding SARP family transcriptional activator